MIRKILLEFFTSVADIVHEQELSEVVQRGIIRAPFVCLRQFFHKVDEVWVLCDHKRADGDLLTAALYCFIQCFVDDLRIEPK